MKRTRCSVSAGRHVITTIAIKNGFNLECLALLRVREEMGLTNVKAMIPFAARLRKAERVIALMAEFGSCRARTISRSTRCASCPRM